MRSTTAFLPLSDRMARFSDDTDTGLSTDADNFELDDNDDPPRHWIKGSRLVVVALLCRMAALFAADSCEFVR